MVFNYYVSTLFFSLLFLRFSITEAFIIKNLTKKDTSVSLTGQQINSKKEETSPPKVLKPEEESGIYDWLSLHKIEVNKHIIDVGGYILIPEELASVTLVVEIHEAKTPGKYFVKLLYEGDLLPEKSTLAKGTGSTVSTAKGKNKKEEMTHGVPSSKKEQKSSTVETTSAPPDTKEKSSQAEITPTKAVIKTSKAKTTLAKPVAKPDETSTDQKKENGKF